MQTLEGLSAAIETTGDIRAIVRTMKSLSAVSIRQYEQAEAALAEYDRTVELGLVALLRARRARGLPLPLTAPPGGGEALIVIGSDRGLCGQYNAVVTRAARERIGPGVRLLAVAGARAAARLDSAGHPADIRYTLPGAIGGLAGVVQRVIVGIDRWTRDRGIARVSLVHTRRAGAILAEPVLRPLLPIPDADLAALSVAEWPGPGVPFFRMPPEALLAQLIRQRLFVLLYRAFAEALVSEHASRLAAMQRAERNIEERQAELSSAYRQKRQEVITRELLDVVSGFEAARRAEG